MENFLNRNDINISYRSFELDPNASYETTSTTKERVAKKYGYTNEQAQQMIDNVTEYANSVGLDFHYATTRYTNTFDAHRISKYAEDVRNDELEASRLGIHSVPYLIINRKYSISGAQSAEVIKKSIEKILQEETAQNIKLDGVTCDSNGCSIPNKNQ